MRSELILSLCILSMGVACGDDPAPTNPGPTNPVAPRTGLVAEYKFNGNANDTGGGANNGSVFGATLTTNRFGSANAAFLFDDDDKITTNNDHFITGNAVSVSLWFKVNAQPPGARYFMLCSDFTVFADATNFGFVVAVPTIGSAEGAVVDLTRWHHLLGTYDGTNIVLYLDGVNVDFVNHPGTILDSDFDLQFGEYDDNFLAGALDDVRIYDRAITDADEIYALYHEGGFGL